MEADTLTHCYGAVNGGVSETADTQAYMNWTKAFPIIQQVICHLKTKRNTWKPKYHTSVYEIKKKVAA